MPGGVHSRQPSMCLAEVAVFSPSGLAVAWLPTCSSKPGSVQQKASGAGPLSLLYF